ncbi:uncharacterized protein A1O9_02706 [Exophiala aquamarina CBS 119918]|uniref:Arrestin-like N-terminal domain-containing protein n=1 Tax=Exophiala aquamarina CBS 119918 TaxID=1182545 RepID=A0A072PMN4_9EURO|nr:uncharacterized protein A1O9_02706 [Exophiala aquamarina CBS 119918]KEF61141.1 hypothetical protein A1O9_02706 [Exophiala aquamarina CBS 119918]
MALFFDFPASGSKSCVPTFLTDDEILGNVYLIPQVCLETLFEAVVEIRLTGHVETSLLWLDNAAPNTDTRSLAYRQTILDVAQRYPVQGRFCAASPGSIDLCHFNIRLAAAAVPGNNNADRCINFDQLPSSLDEKSSAAFDFKSSAPRTVASVSYLLHAKLWRDDVLLVSHSQNIYILNCSDAAPPLCLGDFGQEYNNRHEIVLRKNPLQKIGKISIQANQPDALVFTGYNTSAITKVLLHVKLQTTHGPREGPQSNDFEATVKWRLQSSTFVCMHMQDAVPTTRQLVLSPSMGCITKTISSHDLKMKWSDWTRTEADDPDSTEWTATYPVWLSIKSSPGLPPTFLLPYLSRRYSIAMIVSVPGRWHSKATIKLPVQVAYRSKVRPPQCILESSHLCAIEDHTGREPVSSNTDDHVLPPYFA